MIHTTTCNSINRLFTVVEPDGRYYMCNRSFLAIPEPLLDLEVGKLDLEVGTRKGDRFSRMVPDI